MIRSLLAVIAAVVAGLAVANLTERMGLASPSLGVGAFLLLGWCVGAFVAATVALLIGGRWAPIGWLAAAAMGLQALIGLAGSAHGLPMQLATPFVVALGGWVAVKLWRGRYGPPDASRDDFDV